jgi:hypothetical protein
MSENAPLLIEAAEYAAFGEARIVVEVTGRWVDAPPVPSGESALLIVDGNGLVHRFAEISAAVEDAQAGDEYLGSFVIPAQFRRRIASPTALRAGGITVTVPGATLAGEGPLESEPLTMQNPVPAPPDPIPVEPPPPVHPVPPPVQAAPPPMAAPVQPAPPPVQSGPPIAAAPPEPSYPAPQPPAYQSPPPPSYAEYPYAPRAHHESDPVVEALREKLSQRVSDEARMRRELTELRTQLDARARNYDRLERAQGELRAAVVELSAKLEEDGGQRVALESSNAALEAANASLSAEVAALRASLEYSQAEVLRLAADRDAAVSELSDRYAELATTKVAQETALEEVDELRRELERGGAELAEVRERFGASEVEEAESLLAETRALTARLIGQSGESYANTDDAGD